MTNKESCIKKIRELVAELQELSFGCEVKWNNYICKVIQGEYTEEDDGLNSIILRYESNDQFEEIRIMRELLPEDGNGDWQYDIEILGHPIQLQHVLLAIERKCKLSVAVDSMGTILQWDTEVHWLKPVAVNIYDLTKPFTEQSPEFYDFINEVLK